MPRCTRTTTSTPRSRRTTCSRPRSTSPRHEAIVHDLVPALEHLTAVLSEQELAHDTVVKSGRTHLMDAVPVTLGQEFGGYAAAVSLGVERLEATLPRLGSLPLGGTAVGTGLNAPDGFARGVIETLRCRDGARPARGEEPLRGPGRSGRAGRGERCVPGRGDLVEQDRHRPAVDGVGALDGSARDPAARPAAGQLDHAGQGQPGPARGGAPGGRPGRRQRRRGRLRRCGGHLRAQRDAAGDGPEPVGVDPDPGQRVAGCSPIAASPASSRTSRSVAGTPSRRRRW